MLKRLYREHNREEAEHNFSWGMVLGKPLFQASSSTLPPQAERAAYIAAAPQQTTATCTAATPRQGEQAAYTPETPRQATATCISEIQ